MSQMTRASNFKAQYSVTISLPLEGIQLSILKSLQALAGCPTCSGLIQERHLRCEDDSHAPRPRTLRYSLFLAK